MSEKRVVNAQECDPSTLGLARKPRPAMKRKPETEVVVQLGPFTDGQITAPEMVRPLEGPTEWLIKPKTGEIVPHDAGTPPDKDVIRKYITVGAQDTDVPEDLPKISEGYVVERVNQDVLPNMDSNVRENGTDIVRVVEKEGPASVDCDPMPPPPNTNVDPTDNPPPPPVEKPPVEKPPVEKPPVDEEEPPADCKPKDSDCPTVDAKDDCASTNVDCPVVIDVLKNDLGCGELKITDASAENGTVEIKDGALHYTPNEGFCGEDVISYTIGDENCITDTAHVYMDVKSGDTSSSTSDCDLPLDESANTDCPIIDGKTSMYDYEFSSKPYDATDSIFKEEDQIIQDKLEQVDQLIQSKSSWASSYGASNFDAATCAPAEEPVAVC